MVDQPLSPQRAQALAQAIRSAQPYDPMEAAGLLESLAAELLRLKARTAQAPALVSAAEARAAIALLHQIPFEDA